MSPYLIRGHATRHISAGAPAMPAADTSGYRVRGRGTARPCPDQPAMPVADTSGFRVKGRGIWRAPCDEAGGGVCCPCFIDLFDRDIDPGWGDATSGQTYTTTQASSFSVSDGVGHFATGGGDTVNYSITLPGDCAWQDLSGFMETFDFQAVDVDSNRRIKFETTTGPNMAFEVKISTADGRLYIESVGSSEVAKLDWVADTWYSAKLEYRPGSVMRLKVWLRDDPEPGTWDLELTDADVAGALTSSLRATFSSATEWAADIDNLTICPATCGLYDDFERDVEEGWGDSTPTEQTYFTSAVGVFSVSDGLGRFHNGGNIALPPYCAWQQEGGFVLTFDWFVDSDVDTLFGIGMTIMGDGPFFQFGLERSNVGGGAVAVTSIGTDVVGKSDWDAVAYSVKVEYRPESVMRMRVWPQGDTEPGTWDVSISGADVAGPLGGGTGFMAGGLQWSFVVPPDPDMDGWVGNVTFDCAPAEG